MDRNYIYAKQLSELGDKIKEIDSKYIQSYDLSVANFKDRCNNILTALNEYEECKTALSSIICPPDIRIEHEYIINAIELFIEGSKTIINSVENISEETLNKGILLQKLGLEGLNALLDEIVKKLI